MESKLRKDDYTNNWGLFYIGIVVIAVKKKTSGIDWMIEDLDKLKQL